MAKKRYCMNCGAEIPDGTKFCPNCGAEVKQLEEEEQEPVAVKKPKKHGHKWVWIVVILLVVAAVSGAGTWFYLNHKNPKKEESETVASVVETAKPKKAKKKASSIEKTETEKPEKTAEAETTEKNSSVLPEKTAVPTPTPASSKKDRIAFAGKSWKTVYLQYLDAINSSDSSFSSLQNVSGDQIADFQRKYSLNSKFTFDNKWLKLDQNSYSETDQGNGNYSVAFHTYVLNDCTDRNDGEESDNYVKLSITMIINPQKGTYTLTQQKSDKNYTFSSNMLDITNS